MANPQWVTVMSPFGWYPIGEVYSVVPKWEEWHSVTRHVVNEDDAPNRYSIVGLYDAAEVSFVLSLRETVDDVAVAPSVGVDLTHSLWLQDGYQDARPLTITEVPTLDEPPVWSGDIKVEFPLALRRWLGAGRVGRFSIDATFEDVPDVPVRIAYGTVVFRR